LTLIRKFKRLSKKMVRFRKRVSR